MQDTNYVTFYQKRREVRLNADKILYVLISERMTEIHAVGGAVYACRLTLNALKEQLGDGFIQVHRGCLVSAMAIHNVTSTINLNNGEALPYTLRKKSQILRQLRETQRRIVDAFAQEGIPETPEDYHAHYSSFEKLPFAFTDIEMIFNEESHAVDWIFRYGNPALARLEKLPLEKLIGRTFGSLFTNMDAKWLRGYERATLYGETLEIMDYSPEMTPI